MKIELRDQPFDPWRELSTYQTQMLGNHGKYGATSVFVGTMRDFNNAANISSLFLEHYPDMTKKYLEKICHEAKQEWPILDLLLLHRYGQIEPNESIVLIATWCEHRAPAFEASRYLIEELKHRAPFWKKETLSKNQDTR